MVAHDITQGERRFAIYQYLLKNTNESQVATKAEIKRHLKELYEIEISDPTFYGDISALQGDVYGLEIGFDPKRNKGAGGYFVLNPPFEPKDIRLLIDCIQSANFISQKTADELTAKVKDLSSAKLSSNLERPAFVMGRVRTSENNTMNTADYIHEAISKNKQISFRYFHRVPNSQNPKKYSKSGDRVIVSPFALIWDNGNYYLYAYAAQKQVFRTYRVDRMDKAKVEENYDREGIKEFRKQDVLHKKVKVFDMFRNPKKEYDVSFRCHNMIADAVVDTFGADTMMIPDGDSHFKFSANIEVSPPFFAWVSSFGKRIQIKSPAAVVAEYREFLQKSLEMCKDVGEK